MKEKPYVANPFTRFHKAIEEYPDELFNADDQEFYTQDNYERFKPFMPQEGKYVGTTRVIPFQDTDEKYIHYDLQGESMFTNPPNPNMPAYDFGHEEGMIWNWQKTLLNQNVVKNNYSTEFQSMFGKSNAPWWGKKLMIPTWYKKDKYQKFLKQWEIRKELEALKMDQALELRPGDQKQHDEHTKAINDFLSKAEDRMHEDQLKDVYTTDHTPRPKKFATTSEEEDMQYYNYIKSLEDYNKKYGASSNPINLLSKGKYERGSLLQKMFEPLNGSTRLENGSIFLEIVDKDLGSLCDEEKARKLYELHKKDQTSEDADDSDEIRISIVRDAELESDVDREALREKMDNEFAMFLKGEKYDYVTDLRRSLQDELATPLSAKIFKTIPEHVFWDIKKPRVGTESEYFSNPYNPSRKNPNINFFEMRKHEDWIKSRKEQRNLTAGISHHRNY